MAFTKKNYIEGQTVITAQNLNDINNFLGGGTGNLADYVVEQGTSGSWTYRKWNSGVAECWAKITQMVIPRDAGADTLNLAPYYVMATTPIEFTSIDCVNANVYVGISHTITSSVGVTLPNKLAIPGVSLSLTGPQECYAYIYVTGRWK